MPCVRSPASTAKFAETADMASIVGPRLEASIFNCFITAVNCFAASTSLSVETFASINALSVAAKISFALRP